MTSSARWPFLALLTALAGLLCTAPAMAVAPGPEPLSAPSVELAGKPDTPQVGDAQGDLPLTLSCDSPGGSSCQFSIALFANLGGPSDGASAPLGRWSGSIAGGARRTVAVPLTGNARIALGDRDRIHAKAVIDVAGGANTSTPVLLAAPPEGRLSVRGARRHGDALLTTLSCGGPSTSRCGGRVTIEVPVPDVTLATGEVTVEGNVTKLLSLTEAGRRFLEKLPQPAVTAKAVYFDRVYQRTETVVTRFRLGE